MFLNKPESPQKLFPWRPGGGDINGHKEFFKINRPAFVRIECAENVLAKLFRVSRREEHFIHVNESLRSEFSTGAVLQEARIPLSVVMIKYYRGQCDKEAIISIKRRNHLLLSLWDFPVQLYENGNETFGWVFICLAASPSSNNLSTALSSSKLLPNILTVGLLSSLSVFSEHWKGEHKYFLWPSI